VVVVMVVVMVADPMGWDEDDARPISVMMVMVMMVMAHDNSDLGELDRIGRRIRPPSIVRL
jgi:hypothetical protein